MQKRNKNSLTLASRFPTPGGGQATLGFVLLVAGIIIMVTVSLALVVSSLVNSGLGYQAAEQAELAANSGVEDALLQLSRNKDFSSGSYSLTVGPASVTVAVSQNAPQPGQVTIVSSARAGSNQRRVQAVVSVATSTLIANILSWLVVSQ